MAWYEKNEEVYTVWTELQTEDGLTYFYNTETKETSQERPEELMTEEDRAKQGEWVWLQDEIECYIPAKVIDRSHNHIICETDSGQRSQFPAGTELEPLKQSSLQRLTPDLVLLDVMSVPLILHNLKKRFEAGNIYTHIGTIIISINPYSPLDPPIYGPDVVNKYRMKLADHKQMPPHVFIIGDDAYKGLSFKSGLNQSVIISGESGAGKTEAAKQVVNYLAAVAGSTTGIENKLFTSNPILESFGNAKTVRNNNSSRFGKYMEIYFDYNLKMCASHTTNYLLEKIRVPKPMKDERNYHIFYQLCSSQSQFIEEFNLGDPSKFDYLVRGGCLTADGINDTSDFNDTISAMNEMGFSQDEIHDCFQVIAGILHLGNVVIQSNGSGIEIANPIALQNAAYFIGVTDDDMIYRLTTRKLRIRGQEPVDVPLKLEEAIDARDACAKFVYSKLFDQIVGKINAAMTLGGDGNKYKSIGILDIFGFEIFQENSFEQLCINFTNEKLQQHFNAHVFKLEEELYKNERIDFIHVPFIDNEPILKLIEERPYGILNLLDEECRVPEGNERKFLSKVADAQKNCSNFSMSSFGGGLKFVLIHYAGEVVYTVSNFLEKNRDTLTQDLLDMVTTSQMDFVVNLFPEHNQANTGLGPADGKFRRDDRSRKATLGKQFSGQLNNLMKALNETEPHYIRCIKPNEYKAPLTFNSKNCQEQLTYAGVFESVQIRKAGYPFHMKHMDFVERYSPVLSGTIPKNVQGCRNIIEHFSLSLENIKIGSSMVLYRAEEHRKMELDRSIVIERQALDDTLKRLCAMDPSTMNNPEPYYEELALEVRRANRFKLYSAIAEQARAFLDQFIESRIDPETKALMEQAFNSCDYETLKYAVSVADQYGYQTRMCKDCRKLLIHMTRIREEYEKALDIVDEKALKVCLQAAEACGLNDENIQRIRELLGLSMEKFIQEQMRSAVRKKDMMRQVRLEIQLKDLIFDQRKNMFVIRNYEKLKGADSWASEKMFSREKNRQGQMKQTKESIHSTLTEFPEGKQYKQSKKDALSVFKLIQVFMGDRKPSKAQAFNKKVGLDILSFCFKDVLLRNEFFIQLIKQLDGNYNGGSQKKGQDLMILALNCFPPGKDFENFLHVYLKTSCPADLRSRYILALQTIVLLDQSKHKIPSSTEFDQIVSGKNLRQPEFTDQSPPKAPSQEDLLMNWDERELDEDELLFTVRYDRKSTVNAQTPKNTTVNPVIHPTEKITGQGVSEPQVCDTTAAAGYDGPQVEYIDPESGYPYYLNVETEETTWDRPSEMPAQI